jgi:RNA polymerase sigma-70 factor (ECF subfamily)
MRDLVQDLVAHYGDLRRQLTRELKDPHYAADIAQSSFERVYAQALKLRPGRSSSAASDQTTVEIESPRALLFRVARNLCIDEARRRKTAQDWAREQAALGVQQAAPSSEYLVAQKQVLARVVATLEQLPPRRREVFLLFRAHGYTRAEIAAQLRITEMAVAKHLVRAAIDCSRVFAELRSDLLEPQHLALSAGLDASLAEDFS